MSKPLALEDKCSTETLKHVEDFIGAVDRDRHDHYCKLWKPLTPQTHADYYQRLLFAISSVHTTWQSNVRLYEALTQNYSWLTSTASLTSIIVNSRAGMQTVRTRAIAEATTKYWNAPTDYGVDASNWVGVRDRIETSIFGLGMAKSSFYVELCTPLDCSVFCLDTHMLQLYNLEKVSKPLYKLVENHWVTTCKLFKLSPVIVRHIYWDVVQGQPDSSYWHYVFENEYNMVM